MSGLSGGKLAGVVLFSVKHAKDERPLTFEDEEYLVRKARQQNAPKTAMVKRKAIRVVLQGKHGLADLLEKTISQANLLFLIPLTRFLDIPFSARTDDDAPFHAPRRRRASTSSQDAPTQGFFSKSSISRSSTAFS